MPVKLSWHVEWFWAVVYLGRTAGRATRPEWIHSQRFYFESKAEGEVKIFGFYNDDDCFYYFQK